MRLVLVSVLAVGCASTKAASTATQPAALKATAMSVGTLQLVVARGPFPTDPCQAGWFHAVVDSPDSAAKLDELVAKELPCAVPIARLRLTQLARTDALSWGAETRAADVTTRRELAHFAASAKWDPGTSGVADLVLDADESVRVEALKAVRALRLSIAVGQLEKSLSLKPARRDVERALLCTILSEFNIDVPPAACRGLGRVELPEPVEPAGKPQPNLCRTVVTNLSAVDPATQIRALLELAQPWVTVHEGCSVPNVQLLHLVQNGAADVRAVAAMVLLWSHHPPELRRTPAWPKTVLEPEAR